MIEPSRAQDERDAGAAVRPEVLAELQVYTEAPDDELRATAEGLAIPCQLRPSVSESTDGRGLSTTARRAALRTEVQAPQEARAIPPEPGLSHRWAATQTKVSAVGQRGTASVTFRTRRRCRPVCETQSSIASRRNAPTGRPTTSRSVAQPTPARNPNDAQHQIDSRTQPQRRKEDEAGRLAPTDISRQAALGSE